MFISERKFVTVAREQLQVLEAVWADFLLPSSYGGGSEVVNTPTDQNIREQMSVAALDVVQQYAKPIHALAVLRASEQCKTAVFGPSISPSSKASILNRFSVLGGLVEQYASGLGEIDVEFCSQEGARQNAPLIPEQSAEETNVLTDAKTVLMGGAHGTEVDLLEFGHLDLGKMAPSHVEVMAHADVMVQDDCENQDLIAALTDIRVNDSDSAALPSVLLRARHQNASNVLQPLLHLVKNDNMAGALTQLMAMNQLESQNALVVNDAEQGLVDIATDLDALLEPIENSAAEEMFDLSKLDVSPSDATLTDPILTGPSLDDLLVEQLADEIAKPHDPMLSPMKIEDVRELVIAQNQHLATEADGPRAGNCHQTVRFENLMRPITNLILGEARFLNKRVSISYGADFETIDMSRANRIETVLEIVCLNIVASGVDPKGSQIYISGVGASRADTIIELSWKGKSLADFSAVDQKKLSQNEGQIRTIKSDHLDEQKMEIQFDAIDAANMATSKEAVRKPSLSDVLGPDVLSTGEFLPVGEEINVGLDLAIEMEMDLVNEASPSRKAG